MMEDNAAPAHEISDSVARALARILLQMEPELFIQLSKLIHDVALDTGYGDVKIVIAQGHCDQLKAEKSYKGHNDN